MSKPWQRAEHDLGMVGLVERLAQLPGSKLTSLMLEVNRRRAHARSASDVLTQHRSDAFVAPAAIDQRTAMRLDSLVLEVVPAHFDAIELSPVQPLGTVAAVAKASQNKICSADRSLEVLSDPTNALALVAAERRRAGQELVRLCTSQRVLRMQRVQGGELYTQHFRLWCFVTAGKDSGGRHFEQQALVEHLELHCAILARVRAAGAQLGEPTIDLEVEDAHRSWALAATAKAGLEVASRPMTAGYYRQVHFHVDCEAEGHRRNVSDGGLVDWLAALRSDRRERLFISATGSDRLARWLRTPVAAP